MLRDHRDMVGWRGVLQDVLGCLHAKRFVGIRWYLRRLMQNVECMVPVGKAPLYATRRCHIKSWVYTGAPPSPHASCPNPPRARSTLSSLLQSAALGEYRQCADVWLALEALQCRRRSERRTWRPPATDW